MQCVLLFLVLAGNYDFYVVTRSYSSRPFLCTLVAVMFDSQLTTGWVHHFILRNSNILEEGDEEEMEGRQTD